MRIIVIVFAAILALSAPVFAQKIEPGGLRLLSEAEARAALEQRVLCYAPTRGGACGSISQIVFGRDGAAHTRSVFLVPLADFAADQPAMFFVRSRPAFEAHSDLFDRLGEMRRQGGYMYLRMEDTGTPTAFDSDANAWCSQIALADAGALTRLNFTNSVDPSGPGVAVSAEDTQELLAFLSELFSDGEMQGLFNLLDPTLIPAMQALLGEAPYCEAYRANLNGTPVERIRSEVSIDGARYEDMDEFLTVHESAEGLTLDPGEPSEGEI